MTLDQLNAAEGAKTFLKRIGQPREVANAILFLASDGASDITGTSRLVTPLNGSNPTAYLEVECAEAAQFKLPPLVSTKSRHASEYVQHGKLLQV